MTLRIALVSDWYYPKVGGVASHMHGLALKLKEMGHEVTIVTNDLETGVEEELEERGVSLIKIPGLIAPLLNVNVTYGLKSTNELTSYLEDFDVIHGHHAFTPLSLKAVKAGRILNKASILTTHSISLAHESKLWEALDLTFPLLSSYLKYPHRIIAVSRAAKAFIEHFTSTPVVVIPNGVDSKVFHPGWDREKLKEEFGIEGDVVLYVGRISFRKGPHVLLNAFTRIRSKDAVLVMAGKGPLLPLLKAQARFLGVEERVRFLGYVPRQLLPRVYGMADVFVLPSVTAEAFGVVVLEAMATGLPVVASRVGGVPEIVEDSSAGILVPPSDELSLAEALEQLLEDRELRKELGANGRRAVEERYSWDVVAREVEQCYLEVLAGLR